MTGLPEFNYPLFEKVAQQLRGQGLEVRSLHEHFKDIEHTPGEHPWRHYMKLGIKLLLDCTDIVMLDNWRHSQGATLERHVAENLGMTVWAYPCLLEQLVLLRSAAEAR